MAAFSVPSPKPLSPVSLQVSLVHSAPEFSRAQDKWLHVKNLCVSPLNGSLCLQPFVIGREKPCCSSQLDVICVLFKLLCYRLGTPARGLAHISQGNPPATEISLWHFSCCLWEPSQPSHDSSTLPTSHVVLRLFLLSVWCYKVSLPQLFSCLFQMISPQFCCNSSEVLGGG